MADRTYDWNGHTNLPISYPDLSDFHMAGKVRMLMRSDLDHEGVVCGARDRIMCLSQEKALLEERVQQLEDDLDDARNVPWPEWASSILKTLQHHGYDPVVDGEVDLGEAFKDYLEGVSQAEEQDRKRSAEKDATINRLGGALQRIASKASALARDPDAFNRGLWQACLDEAQAALSPTPAKGTDNG